MPLRIPCHHWRLHAALPCKYQIAPCSLAGGNLLQHIGIIMKFCKGSITLPAISEISLQIANRRENRPRDRFDSDCIVSHAVGLPRQKVNVARTMARETRSRVLLRLLRVCAPVEAADHRGPVSPCFFSGLDISTANPLSPSSSASRSCPAARAGDKPAVQVAAALV